MPKIGRTWQKTPNTGITSIYSRLWLWRKKQPGSLNPAREDFLDLPAKMKKNHRWTNKKIVMKDCSRTTRSQEILTAMWNTMKTYYAWTNWREFSIMWRKSIFLRTSTLMTSNTFATCRSGSTTEMKKGTCWGSTRAGLTRNVFIWSLKPQWRAWRRRRKII